MRYCFSNIVSKHSLLVNGWADETSQPESDIQKAYSEHSLFSRKGRKH